MAILPDLTAMSQAELIAFAQAQAAKLALATKPRKLTLKVSAKGGVALYGMGKFPVTLYKGQWERVIEYIGEIQDFIKANEGLLATKD